MFSAESFFRQPCTFIFGSVSTEPETTLPEIAFIGRSNVGKSSLLNALTYRRNLARTSMTPGRTQQLNFFRLGNDLYLVDMPGYGYAAVGHKTQRTWSQAMESYLLNRPTLRRIIVLIDSRHSFKENDKLMLSWLHSIGAPTQVVLTKSDAVPYKDQPTVLAHYKEHLALYPCVLPTVLLTSTKTQQGIDEFRHSIWHDLFSDMFTFS